MPPPVDANALYQVAVRRLAAREHSVAELRARLQGLGTPEVVETVLQLLVAQGLLSDERYAHMRERTAERRGWGPVRLRRELEKQGIGAETVDQIVNGSGHRWAEDAERVRRRRFGPALPEKAEDTVRQMRFLQARGFTMEQIRRVLKGRVGDDWEQG